MFYLLTLICTLSQHRGLTHIFLYCVWQQGEEEMALPFFHKFRQHLYLHKLSWMNSALMWGLLMWTLQSDPAPVWKEEEQRVSCHWLSVVRAPVCVSWRERQQESRKKVGRDPTTTKITQEILCTQYIVWFCEYKDEAKIRLLKGKKKKRKEAW